MGCSYAVHNDVLGHQIIRKNDLGFGRVVLLELVMAAFVFKNVRADNS